MPDAGPKIIQPLAGSLIPLSWYVVVRDIVANLPAHYSCSYYRPSLSEASYPWWYWR